MSNLVQNYARLKVLHVCETAKGGIGTYINTLCTITSNSVENIVIGPDIHQDVLNANIEVHTFRHTGRNVGTSMRLIFSTVAGIFRNKPDVVFYHSSFALLPMAVSRALFWRKPFIYCAHGWADGREQKESLKVKLIRFVEGTLCGVANRVLNVSANDLRLAKKNRYLGRQILVENAVLPFSGEENISRPLSRNINLLFIGRLDRQKGIDILLSAFAVAKEKNRALVLTVAGERVISSAGDETNLEGVDFLGWINAERVGRLLKEADILVVPSRWEGLPLVIPEALRCGTPVLVSDRSNLPDLIEPGKTGYVSCLDVTSLAGILVNLDKNTLESMRHACRDLFQRRYHSDRLKAEIMSLYTDLEN